MPTTPTPAAASTLRACLKGLRMDASEFCSPRRPSMTTLAAARARTDPSPRSKDQLAHVLALASAISTASERDNLGLVTNGEAKANREIRLCQWRDPVPSALSLQPREGARAVLESPRLDQPKRLR